MSRSGTLAVWIGNRVPPVPRGFREWMDPADPEAPASVDTLVDETRRALAFALRPDGRPRGGAFDLLAADGFATWACEAALEQEDPDDALGRILAVLVE